MLATKIVSEDGISYNLTPLGYVVLIAVVIVVLAVVFIVKDKKTQRKEACDISYGYCTRYTNFVYYYI